MSRVREIALRVANAGLVSALMAVQRGFNSETIYKVDRFGAAAMFEGSWFAYHPKQFGATGNIDFAPDAENETREAIFARLRGSEVFYDIGAHGGVYTITLQKRFPDLVIHSFEPQPEDLKRNLALNSMDSRRVHAVAVGDEAGTVQMTTAIRSSNHVSVHGDRAVSMVRLDDYAHACDLPEPAWIKIDIEGLEMPALRGAEQLLRKSHPTVICEINHLFGRFGTKIDAFIAFMESVGLYPHRLNEGVLHPIRGATTLKDLGYSADNNFWFMPQ